MLNFRTLIPGIIASSGIIVVLGSALLSICYYAITSGEINSYIDSYLLHILWITFYQATLSTCLSIILAILMAKALSMVDFWGKRLLLRIMPVTFILPALVVVTGLLSVYGQQGLLSSIFTYLGRPFSWSIYGLKGILLAHIFLNFPYVCCLFYRTLMSVPVEQKQLAAQLNFSGYTFFRLVEWPHLRRQILPMASLIFMLCFSSFAIVLALGGGPKYTTIEVAIYQSIRDFDFIQAVLLSLLQLLCCVGFMGIMQKFNNNKQVTMRFIKQNYRFPVSGLAVLLSSIMIIMGGLFILLPLINIVIDGVYFFRLSLFTPTFQHATLFSLFIALGSALVTLLMSLFILWTNSRLLIYHKITWSNRLMLASSLILAIPSMILASGLFILFYQYAGNTWFICILLILCNALMALPFVIKSLAIPMFDVTKRYWLLSQSLNIEGMNHFYLIEYKALNKLMLKSFVFSAILSLGDFGIIALFGGQSVITLPYYLYEQLSHYHYQDGSVTAAILLIISFSLLVLVDDDHSQSY